MKVYKLKKQSGMSLLEVVVSMLIIGLGLVMAASMIQASNRYGESAEYRSMAIDKIQSIADSMRANALGGQGYVWGRSNYMETGYNPNNVPLQTVTPCVTNCKTKDTLKDQAESIAYRRAQADLITWLGQVATSLPGGQASIGRHGSTYTVTVMWQVNAESDSLGIDDIRTESIDFTFDL
ncbi:type IV pilus modification protein PilV [Rappaport israeli]|uniref:type IV pilus modification protein PilV n=1 Tax=Rappaport israeli TaxID=1839807 RepID=UPI000931D012|nr:type IV pilus modification protein PilV [Rappaport israeli]